jgi:stalled ribosome rescue protein Dom34
MRILKRFDEGVRIRISGVDDLWTLAHICRKGSSLGMLGHRRDQTTGTKEGGRAKSAERKPMWIVISVEGNEFQPFSDALRVSGIITEARIDSGSHHTHSLRLGDEVELKRSGGIDNSDLRLLEEAVSAGQRPRVILCVVESDEVIVFEVASHGLREVSQSTLRGGGKREKGSNAARSSFVINAAKATAMLLTDETPTVICGPGMTRDSFEKELRAAGASGKLLNIPTSIGGRSAANEVLGGNLTGDVLEAHAVARQTRLIEDGLTRIAVNGAVAYGGVAIAAAAEQGAIETLIIDAALLRQELESQKTGATKRVDWPTIEAAVIDAGGIVEQASLEHDAGAQLEGFGGAIALLRWRVDPD